MLISFGSMAQTTTAINGTKYTYTKIEKKITEITVPSLNTKLTIEGSNSVASVTAAIKAYLLNQVPTLPPIGAKPTFKLPEGNYKSVSAESGKTLDLGQVTSNIKLTPGNYSNIYITWANASNAIIDFTGSTFENCVIEAGKSTNVKLFGGSFKNTAYRVLRFDFASSNLEFYNITFTNCGDYAVTSNNSNVVGVMKGLKFMNCTFDGSGQISLGGDVEKNIGQFSGTEIAYCTFKNTSPGNCVSLSNVSDFDFHDNLVDNVNTQNNNHNGVFFAQGNGKFYNNLLKNYQGNAIRVWLFSRGSTPTTVEIYNNICYSTRKYGAFELQEFSRNLIPGRTTFANAKVYNNTAGNLNTNKDWEGQMLDLYSLSGTLEYYNNLGFDMVTVQYQKQVTNMINNMGNTKIVKEENNKYFLGRDEAVDKDFTSKLKGVGALQ